MPENHQPVFLLNLKERFKGKYSDFQITVEYILKFQVREQIENEKIINSKI